MITYTDYNTHTNDVQWEWVMIIEMAIPMVKEHVSSTEVLTGVRYMWIAVLKDAQLRLHLSTPNKLLINLFQMPSCGCICPPSINF